MSSIAQPADYQRFLDGVPSNPWSHQIHGFAAVVERRFGVKLRNWQGQVMKSIWDGNDVLVRAGTGYGKSLLFQSLAELRDESIVLVIVPILALMEEQVNFPFVSTDGIGRGSQRVGTYCNRFELGNH